MQFPVNEIQIFSSGDDENINELVQYWYKFCGKYLRYKNEFPSSSINRYDDKIKIIVSSYFTIELMVFKILAFKFNQLKFWIKGSRRSLRIDQHILIFRTGSMTIHLNRFEEEIENEKDIEKEIIYIFDHVNKIARIEKEIIRSKNPNFFKKYLIIYDEGYTDYVERKDDYE